MRILFLIILTALSVENVNAQNRADRPIQIQVNLSGFALSALGETLRNRDLVDLQVKEYSMPGLSLGYNVSPRIYLGYSFHPNRRYILKEEFSFTDGVDDILLTVDHNSGTFHTLEARYTPFAFGLYVSGFFTHVSEASYDLSGVPIGDSYEIGSSVYADALNASWNFKDLTTFGIGIGYNHVTSSGLSFGLGTGFPIKFAKDLYDDIKVIQTDPEFTQEDVELIQDRLDSEEFYFPVQFYLNAGWNF